jgi:transposase
MALTAQDIADIYKQRWQIELLFKKMKQNFQLHCFYGESENAIRIQIWCTLIAQLLLTVLQRKTKTKKAFSTIACLVRQHLLSYLKLEELLLNSIRFYDKYRKTVDYSDSLFLMTG